MNNENIISSTRKFETPVSNLYRLFADSSYLKEWWGPEGFTNTIHEFDLRPQGKWRLTMHGPEKGNYENLSVFSKVVPDNLVSWTRLTPPFFDMEVQFEDIKPSWSKITFLMIFKTKEECEKLKNFILPKNEENFDKLERLLNKQKQD